MKKVAFVTILSFSQDVKDFGSRMATDHGKEATNLMRPLAR